MAKALFEFHCVKCGNTHERFTDSSDVASQCPSCHQLAAKAVTAPRHLKVDGFPVGIMGDTWAKTREDNAHRKFANNGT